MTPRFVGKNFSFIAVGIIFFSISITSPISTFAESPKSTKSRSYLQVLSGEDEDSDRSKWDRVYKKDSYVFGKDPASFLKENIKLLPKGRVLDIAMGEGRNAVFLAQKGFQVEGVDLSTVAIRKARRLAQERGVKIKTIVADLNKYQIQADQYDVILVFYYLQRSLVPQIKKGLKPGGIVVFENYTVDHLRHDKTFNKNYLLEVGELKELFKDLEIIKYSETDGKKGSVASLIARKP